MDVRLAVYPNEFYLLRLFARGDDARRLCYIYTHSHTWFIFINMINIFGRDFSSHSRRCVGWTDFLGGDLICCSLFFRSTHFNYILILFFSVPRCCSSWRKVKIPQPRSRIRSESVFSALIVSPHIFNTKWKFAAFVTISVPTSLKIKTETTPRAVEFNYSTLTFAEFDSIWITLRSQFK